LRDEPLEVVASLVFRSCALFRVLVLRRFIALIIARRIGTCQFSFPFHGSAAPFGVGVESTPSFELGELGEFGEFVGVAVEFEREGDFFVRFGVTRGFGEELGEELGEFSPSVGFLGLRPAAVFSGPSRTRVVIDKSRSRRRLSCSSRTTFCSASSIAFVARGDGPLFRSPGVSASSIPKIAFISSW
jgi:hypothetical protein